MMSTWVDDKECHNQGRHGLCFPKKGRRSSKVAKKGDVNDGNKGFLQCTKEMKNNLG
jgi:hypothetical protein